MADFFNSKYIFEKSKVKLEFYSTAKRNVIVFQLEYDKYVYWAVTGGEDHRLIVSAKGPFDNTLLHEDGVVPVAWKENQVNEGVFIKNVGKSRDDIIALFEGYKDIWIDNLIDLS